MFQTSPLRSTTITAVVLCSGSLACDPVGQSESAQQEVAAWTADSVPTVSIGEVEGEQPYLFSRIAGATRLSSGHIAVADRGSQEIRVFDSNGQFSWKVGGRGGGPGEFRALSWIRSQGDTLIAYDAQTDWVSYLDENGALIRTEELPVPRMAHWEILGPFDDGSFVGVDFGRPEPASAGPRVDTLTFHRMRLDGVAKLVEVGGRDLFRVVDASDGPVFNLDLTRPFGRRVYYAWARDRFWAADNAHYVVPMYSALGERLGEIRRDIDQQAVSSSDVARYIEAAAASARQPGFVKYIEEGLPEAEPGDRVPAFGPMHADRDGHVWIARWVLPGAPHLHWDVYDETGELIAEATVPPNLDILEIGVNYLLGIETGPYGVERIRMYEVIRDRETEPGA